MRIRNVTAELNCVSDMQTSDSIVLSVIQNLEENIEMLKVDNIDMIREYI